MEYKYTLSRASVTAGEVIVELNNQGEDAHNLNLQLANGQGPEYSVPEAGSQKRQESATSPCPPAPTASGAASKATRNWG